MLSLRPDSRIIFLLALLSVCLVSSLSATDEVAQIKVSLDRDTIGLDEQAIMIVEISGTAQNLPRPILPTLGMFEVYSQGRSSNVSIYNGKVESTVTYRYMVLPQRAGTFPIRGVALVHKNKRYEGNPVELTVISQGTSASKDLQNKLEDSKGKSRDYYMDAVVSNKNPYVNQQVTLTLKIYFAVQTYGSPELSEPSTTGFWTEIVGNKAPYLQKIKGRRYKVIERKYALFPTQTGKLTIGRAILSATVARRRTRKDPFDVFGMFGSGEEVKMRTIPVDIEVKKLPTSGRPKDFTGTIGRFTITATANKRKVDVNQPVSVTFRINGTGNIKSVAAPILPDMKEFRIYRASSSENISKVDDKIGGTKIFEEVFIPKVPGQLTIPSLSFNYFDPDKGRYEIASTKPITLHVSKPEGYVADPEVPYAEPEMTIGANANDIRHIKNDPGELKQADQLILLKPLYLVVNSIPVILLAGMIAFRIRREKLAGDIGYARSRSASKMARKRLSTAKAKAQVETSTEFYAELSFAVLSYVSDKLNISPHGLTTEKLALLLREKSAEEQLISDVSEFLKQCDFARFAPSAVDQAKITASLADAEFLIVRIEGVSCV